MRRTTVYGFTLIELIVVITILSTTLALGLASYNGFNQKEKLRQAALNFKSALRLAQTKSISAEKPNIGCTAFNGMRITFTSTTYTLRHHCDPEGYAGEFTTFTLPDSITFNPVPTNFTFLSRTNTTNLTVDRTFTFTNGSQNYIIVISPNGNINDLGIQ